MIQINLLPDTKLELVRLQRSRLVVASVAVMVMIASAVILVLLAAYVFGVQSVLVRNATNNIAQANEEFRSIEDIEKTVTVSNQLGSIQSSHENKTMTSRIFALLAEASAEGTENSVAINSFDIDTEQNRISIAAQTQQRGFDAAEVFRKNIEGMQLFYLAPEEDALPNEFSDSPLTRHDDEESVLVASDVQLSNMVLARDGNTARESVSFRIDFVYDLLLFDQTIDMLRIRGLDRGNVTDSYTRLPQSLFATTDEQKGDE